jgi:predicted RNA-binding protein with PIN domain
MADYLIVDGHSVIFGWPELQAMHSRHREAARELLVRRLTNFQDQSGIRVVLVFDGKGGRVSEATEKGGIQVFYSSTGTTADDLIERLVAKYAGKRHLTVATSDRMERQTVYAFGADSISADTLREWLERAEKDFARTLKHHAARTRGRSR